MKKRKVVRVVDVGSMSGQGGARVLQLECGHQVRRYASAKVPKRVGCGECLRAGLKR